MDNIIEQLTQLYNSIGKIINAKEPNISVGYGWYRLPVGTEIEVLDEYWDSGKKQWYKVSTFFAVGYKVLEFFEPFRREITIPQEYELVPADETLKPHINYLVWYNDKSEWIENVMESDSVVAKYFDAVVRPIKKIIDVGYGYTVLYNRKMPIPKGYELVPEYESLIQNKEYKVWNIGENGWYDAGWDIGVIRPIQESVEVGYGYNQLKIGEVLKTGDEFCYKYFKNEKWITTNNVGGIVGSEKLTGVYRRKIPIPEGFHLVGENEAVYPKERYWSFEKAKWVKIDFDCGDKLAKEYPAVIRPTYYNVDENYIPNAGYGYYILPVGEIIQSGDETLCLRDDRYLWDSALSVGSHIYNYWTFYRRIIPIPTGYELVLPDTMINKRDNCDYKIANYHTGQLEWIPVFDVCAKNVPAIIRPIKCNNPSVEDYAQYCAFVVLEKEIAKKNVDWKPDWLSEKDKHYFYVYNDYIQIGRTKDVHMLPDSLYFKSGDIGVELIELV